MTQISRQSPALAADMIEADRELLAPILADFRSRCAAIANRCPGGVLLAVDQLGPARQTARQFRTTPRRRADLAQELPRGCGMTRAASPAPLEPIDRNGRLIFLDTYGRIWRDLGPAKDIA